MAQKGSGGFWRVVEGSDGLWSVLEGPGLLWRALEGYKGLQMALRSSEQYLRHFRQFIHSKCLKCAIHDTADTAQNSDTLNPR